jgi:hypothetical protein
LARNGHHDNVFAASHFAPAIFQMACKMNTLRYPYRNFRVKIATIISTLCEASRREQLWRAIESIKAASTSCVRMLVVVNGQRFDSEILASLRDRTDLEVVQVELGSQNACPPGRAQSGKYRVFFVPG